MNSRLSALGFELQLRRGYPERVAYGEGGDEAMDTERAPAGLAPILIFIHPWI